MLRLWDLTTGKELHRWEMITGMAFSPDGKILATVRRDGVIRRWNPATGMEIDRADRSHRSCPVATIHTGWKDAFVACLERNGHGLGPEDPAQHQSLFEGPIEDNRDRTMAGRRTFPRTEKP